MKQLQFYKYTTLGLFVLNISMIAFFFLTAPPRPEDGERGRPSGRNIIQLDKDQAYSFSQLAEKHIALMDDLSSQQSTLLNSYFASITAPNKLVQSDSVLTQVQSLERKKIESTYQHFEDVKSILRKDQFDEFEQFVELAIDRILLVQNDRPGPEGRKRK